jgi:hypothetical protein
MSNPGFFGGLLKLRFNWRIPDRSISEEKLSPHQFRALCASSLSSVLPETAVEKGGSLLNSEQHPKIRNADRSLGREAFTELGPDRATELASTCLDEIQEIRA